MTCLPITGSGAVLIRGSSVGAEKVLGELLEILIDEPDYEWLMIDASHIKVHPHAVGAKGGNQDMSKAKERKKSLPPKKYIWPWMRMVCQSKSLLQKIPERIIKKLSPSLYRYLGCYLGEIEKC